MGRTSTLTIKDDVAILRQKPRVIFLKLRKSNGSWLVDIGGSIDAASLKMIPDLETRAAADERTSADIAAGKIATLTNARRLLQDRGDPINDVPETEPTTEPSR